MSAAAETGPLDAPSFSRTRKASWRRGWNMNDSKQEHFEERRNACSQNTRDILAFLQTAAEYAGADVRPPTFEARGIGITYWTGKRRFCRFDPKHQADHVWALVPGGDRVALASAGRVSEREDGPWVTVGDMPGAVRLVPEILRAYDALRS
jgi:hypothetical protein